MNTLIIGYLIAHLICGIFAYGITFGYFQNKWPTLAFEDRKGDMFAAIISGLAGPIGLFSSFFLSNRVQYGMKFNPSK